MFEALSEKLGGIFHRLGGRGRISESNVHEAMRDVRTALLEADVNLRVARRFCDDVVEKAIGAQVSQSLHPGEMMKKLVYDELVATMGPVDHQIHFVSPPPTILMLAGLQGSGKTTTCAKLAKLLISRGKRPMLVAADLQRPAAIHQLAVLGEQVGVPVYREDDATPVRVCQNAVKAAAKQDCDVLVLDTAGRLHIDEELMAELRQIDQKVHPHEVYLVCDAMTGQDAVNSAKEFNDQLELDGVILTKLDGDARGGAALSVKAVTGKPIKFVGEGEKLDRLSEFHPERMAGRILGEGDIMTVVERVQSVISVEEQEANLRKLMEDRFTLDDFMKQMGQMRRVGSMKDIVKMMPGMAAQMKNMDMDDREIDRMQAIVQSMTKAEREEPDIIDGSRRRRIARGSGAEAPDVSGLVKSFDQVRHLMRQMRGLGPLGRMRMVKQLGQVDMFARGGPKFKRRLRSKRKRSPRKRRK